jgi:hypothetical protein
MLNRFENERFFGDRDAAALAEQRCLFRLYCAEAKQRDAKFKSSAVRGLVPGGVVVKSAALTKCGLNQARSCTIQ